MDHAFPRASASRHAEQLRQHVLKLLRQTYIDAFFRPDLAYVADVEFRHVGLDETALPPRFSITTSQQHAQTYRLHYAMDAIVPEDQRENFVNKALLAVAGNIVNDIEGTIFFLGGPRDFMFTCLLVDEPRPLDFYITFHIIPSPDAGHRSRERTLLLYQRPTQVTDIQ